MARRVKLQCFDLTVSHSKTRLFSAIGVHVSNDGDACKDLERRVTKCASRNARRNEQG